MEVVLIDKIEKLGDIGDVVAVRPGYARNYLIPQGKAMYATEQNQLEARQKRDENKRRLLGERSLAEKRLEKLKELRLSLPMQAMEDGRLYGSVNVSEIAKLIFQACELELQKQNIDLPKGPIRTVGTYPVVIHLHDEVQQSIQLHVIAAQRIASGKDSQEEEQPSKEAPQHSPDMAADTDAD